MPGSYKTCFFLLAFFITCGISHAQGNKNVHVHNVIDSLKDALNSQKEDTNKVTTLNNLSIGVANTSNYQQADSYAGQAAELAKKLNFKSGEASAYNNMGNIHYAHGDYPNALKYHFIALQIRQSINDNNAVASSYNNIGLVYTAQGDYPDALKNQVAGLKIKEQAGDKLGIATLHNNIGDILRQQADYTNALSNYATALKIYREIDYRAGISEVYANMGNIYSEQGRYQDALDNQLLALRIAQEIGYNQFIAAAYGDIADLYIKLKNYPNALTNALLSLKTAGSIGYKKGIAAAYVDIGKVFTVEKKYPAAQKYLDSALLLSKAMGSKELIKASYCSYALLDSVTGDYKAAFTYYKMYGIYRDSLKNEEYTKMMLSEQMNYEFDKKMATEKASQEEAGIIRAAEIKRKTTILYGLIIFFLLLSGFIIYSLQVKRKKDKLIAEKETAMLKMENQLVLEELQSAQNALNEYMNTMAEKNKLLEEFKADIENLKMLKSNDLDDLRIKQLENLNRTSILTKEDWDKFRMLFEQVHKGFIARLKNRFTDITQAELRLICLTKLELDTKQMAGILGVSYNTIKQTRYQLRKKLNLSEEEGIEKIVESV